MPVIIHSNKHVYVRIPLLLISLIAFAISPILISMIGALISESISGQPCNEANCIWGAFGWLFMLTFPIAILTAIILMIIVISDILKLDNKNKP